MKDKSSKLFDKWQYSIFRPYFILRYGYDHRIESTSEDNSLIPISHDYEKESGFVDSITILNSDAISVYYSHIDKISFALINNHFLQNQDLPKQYCSEQEIPIISHEFAHCFAEIIIYLFFQSYTSNQGGTTYTPLGEGLILGLQNTCLSIKTHYGDHEFTAYLLIGKSFFKWFRDEIEDYNKKSKCTYDKLIHPICDIISQESNNVKKLFFKIRNDFINLRNCDQIEDFLNDIVIQADFTEYIPILKQYCPLLLLKNYILPEFTYSAKQLIDKVSIVHPASYHNSIGSGYISYYIVEADANGNLTYEKTLSFLAKGLKLFYSMLEIDTREKALKFTELEIKKNLDLKHILITCFGSIEEFLNLND